ncbi:MAG: trp operon repressor [Candidatus Wolfebacteria bacterium]|nr:trp operon repressor [Candidatus Wolfebacteria bacterium]
MGKKEKEVNFADKSISDKILAVIPPIENYSSRKEWEDACWKKISKAEEILDLLTTSYERHNFVMRVAALKGFISGKSYRQISNDLFLSLQTISSIKKAITENHYRSYQERSKIERKKKKYSKGPGSNKDRYKQWREGRRVRTKYGTVYVRS